MQAMIEKPSHERAFIESEARSFCDKRGITNYEDYQRICAAMAHQEFMRCIQPYLKIRVSVFAMQQLDRIIVRGDFSTSEVILKELSPEAQTLIDTTDDLIKSESIRWGFKLIEQDGG